MRRVIPCFLCICISFILAGCSIKENKTDKLNDLEFTIVEKEEIPEELSALIKKNKETQTKVAYEDKEYLYIVSGYGKQVTSGYSIEVTELYESSNAVYIHTNLLGPSEQEKVEQIVTYPYVVVRTGNIDKKVVFD